MGADFIRLRRVGKRVLAAATVRRKRNNATAKNTGPRTATTPKLRQTMSKPEPHIHDEAAPAAIHRRIDVRHSLDLG